MKHDARACAALIAGGIDKYVMDAARDTIALNASMDSECLGWLRVAGPDACDLCVTCASGSSLYHTRTTAGGTPESTYHPGCRCGVVAVFGHGDKAVYVEPETGQRVKLDRSEAARRYEEVVAKGGAARRGKKRVKLLIDDFDDFERRIEGTTSIDELMAIAAEADARIPAKMRKVPAYANLQKVARRKRDELRTAESLSDEPIAASSVYANRSTEFYRRARLIKPKEGYDDVTMHTDAGKTFGYFDASGEEAGRWSSMTVDELAESLRDDPGYSGGPIRLISCSAGKYSDGLAQQLANKMGVEVLAPDQDVYIDRFGGYTLARNDDHHYLIVNGFAKETGSWVSFVPDRDVT